MSKDPIPGTNAPIEKGAAPHVPAQRLPVYGYSLFLVGPIPIVQWTSTFDSTANPPTAFRLIVECSRHREGRRLLADSRGRVNFPLDPDPRFEHLLADITTKRRATIQLHKEGGSGADLIHQGQVDLLPASVWPHDPLARIAIAAYVSPENPRVKELCAELMRSGQKRARTMSTPTSTGDPAHALDTLRDLYGLLAQGWSIEYAAPTVVGAGLPTSHQRILDSDEVLYDGTRHVGRGNCLDLTLLFASCLARLGLDPLIVFNRDLSETPSHAFLGLWVYTGRRLAPIRDHAALLSDCDQGEMLFLEATGICRGAQSRSFEDALASGRDRVLLDRAQKHHAVDVRALMSRPRALVPLEQALDRRRRQRAWVQRITVGGLLLAAATLAWALNPGRRTVVLVQPAPGATLTLESDPGSARIEIAGEAVGEGHITRALEPGESTRIRLSAPGYRDTTLVLVAQPRDSLHVRVELQSRRGLLRVETDPTNAEILVDGERAGRSPVKIDRLLLAREHEILARLPGFLAARRRFAFGADSVGRINLVLSVAASGLLVTSEPAGAGVRVDGAYRGETPITMTDLVPGNHQVTLEWDESAKDTTIVTGSNADTLMVVRPVLAGPLD